MSQVGRRRATYQDLLLVPDEKVAEIVDGELIVSPRPAIPHAQTSSALLSQVHGAFGRRKGGPGQPGGWHILHEPELHFGDDILVPDLAGFRKERLPALAKEAFFTVAPDWACEVLSPSTKSLDRVRKLPIYARQAVGHLWFIEPIEHVLEVFRLEQASYRSVAVYAGARMVRAEPFDAVELDLSEWWLPS